MQNFEEAVNAQRMHLHETTEPGSELRRLSRGKFRFLFLKRASTRTQTEKQHIDSVLETNQDFTKLEVIKEAMLHFFDAPSEAAAKEVFEQIGDWIWQAGFGKLMDWYRNFDAGWETVKNYFVYRVTSALSEDRTTSSKPSNAGPSVTRTCSTLG
jgi:hypothetical protein